MGRLYLIIGIAAVIVIVALLWLRRKNPAAKTFTGNVDSVDARDMPVSRAPAKVMPHDMDAELRALLASGNKIEAIKRVRQQTGLGLKEAREYIERL